MRGIGSSTAVILTVGLSFGAVGAGAAPPRPSLDEKRVLADEMDAYLSKHVLNPRFPACVEKEKGGFHTTYSRDWTPLPDRGEFIVYQSRVVWTAATVALLRPARRDEFLPYVRHGVRYLADVMWDRQNGGFHNYVDLAGQPSTFGFMGGRPVYGQAFAIYSLATAHAATGDAEPLELAKRGYRWVEEHYKDAGFAGYRSSVLATGQPIPEAPDGKALRSIEGPASNRTMNDHIHLLEAYSELLRVWRDPALAKNTEELLQFVRDRLVVEPGYLRLALTADGKVVPSPVSFGHDVETAFLMIEAEEALGRKPSASTLKAARMLVDHALAKGFEHGRGQLFEQASVDGTPSGRPTEWWSQFEAVNALLLMHDLFGKETNQYWVAFEKAWALTRDKLADSPAPGVCGALDTHGEPQCEMKSHDWFVSYHSSRALLLSADRLRKP